MARSILVPYERLALQSNAYSLLLSAPLACEARAERASGSESKSLYALPSASQEQSRTCHMEQHAGGGGGGANIFEKELPGFQKKEALLARFGRYPHRTVER